MPSVSVFSDRLDTNVFSCFPLLLATVLERLVYKEEKLFKYVSVAFYADGSY